MTGVSVPVGVGTVASGVNTTNESGGAVETRVVSSGSDGSVRPAQAAEPDRGSRSGVAAMIQDREVGHR